jgi:hypothetical protein
MIQIWFLLFVPSLIPRGSLLGRFESDGRSRSGRDRELVGRQLRKCVHLCSSPRMQQPFTYVITTAVLMDGTSVVLHTLSISLWATIESETEREF